ncbi:MAG: hypothetical protein KKI18_04615, partial [Planctomycetes bacterium]|nr:hypothetical protein [Planctomycetota bacterium]
YITIKGLWNGGYRLSVIGYQSGFDGYSLYLTKERNWSIMPCLLEQTNVAPREIVLHLTG